MAEKGIFERLADPFATSEVKWRVGGRNREKTRGQALAYIDARAVMERLDEVLTPPMWSDEYRYVAEEKVVMCRLSLCIGGEWVSKEDGAEPSDIEPGKGAISDAFKRAGVKWGVARYLYSLSMPWVELKDEKWIKPSEYDRLNKLLVSGVDTPRPPVERSPLERSIDTVNATDKADRLVVLDGKFWTAQEESRMTMEEYAQISFAIENRMKQLGGPVVDYQQQLITRGARK